MVNVIKAKIYNCIQRKDLGLQDKICGQIHTHIVCFNTFVNFLLYVTLKINADPNGGIY